MDELIAQVSQRTGLSPEQAKAAAQAVVEHLRRRIPGPLASHLEQFLGAKSNGGVPVSVESPASRRGSGECWTDSRNAISHVRAGRPMLVPATASADPRRVASRFARAIA